MPIFFYREYIDHIHVNNFEWVIPMDDQFENFRKAIFPLIENIKQKAAKGEFPVTLAFECRLMADSDVLLAPAICGM